MKVAVIGAGLAGLTAADFLQRNGLEVVVVEARERVGGRIFTIREGFADGQYADMGAEIVYGGQPLVPELCARFGVKLSKSFDLGNRTRRLVFAGALLSDEERDNTVADLRSAFAEQPPASFETAASWGRRARVGTHALHLMRALAQSSPGASPRHVDPREVEKNLTHGAGIRKIVGGADRLPMAMAKTLEVRLGCPAHSIRWSRAGVEIHAEGGTFPADRCVVATPGPVTLELGFDPPLPSATVLAHLAMRYGAATRIIVQYAEGAMLRKALGSGVFTNSAPASLHDQSMHLPGSAIVLSGIAGGDDEPSLVSEEEVLAQADAAVRIAAGAPATRLFGAVKSWTRDPWSRAIVRAPIGDQRDTVIPTLAAPLGDRIYFAGEHTDDRPGPGGMEGAVRSGLRAAREVHASRIP